MNIIKKCKDADWLLDDSAKGAAKLGVIDPPYGTTNNDWDKIPPIDEFWRIMDYVIAPSGIVCIFGNMPTIAKWFNGADYGFKFSHELIWVKSRPTSFQLANVMPMKKHELIWVFKRGGKNTYNPQKIQTEGYYRKRGTGTVSTNWKVKLQTEGDGKYEGRFPVDVLDFGSISYGHHSTQKPVGIIEWLIKTYSNPQDIIFDPYMGSGTTAVSAKNTDRGYLCGDLSDEYIAIANGRLDGTLGDTKFNKAPSKSTAEDKASVNSSEVILKADENNNNVVADSKQNKPNNAGVGNLRLF